MNESLALDRFEDDGGPPPQTYAGSPIGIRRARSADVPTIVVLGIRFITESPFRGLIIPDPDNLRAIVDALLAHGYVAVAERAPFGVVGIFGAQLQVHPMSGEVVATEVVWYVDPAHRRSSAGGRLLAAAERWAREAGAVRVQMIQPAGNDRLADHYRRRGYVEVETVWQKNLQEAA